jgi:FkbM family methyltransferase
MPERPRTLVFKSMSRLFLALPKRGTRKVPVYRNLYRSLYESMWSFWPPDNILEIQGSKMFLEVFHADTTLRNTFRSYALNRVHEKNTTELFRKVLRPGSTFLDLGANIGYFSLLAARLVGKKGRVYSFEPEPRNFRYLTKNIQINNYAHATLEPKAVSDSPGQVKLYICPYDSGHHTINQPEGIRSYRQGYDYQQEEYVEVDKVCLDEYFPDQPVDVIKMDVEGAELLALTGMDRLIRRQKSLRMFVEFFPLLIREMGGLPEEFIRRLRQDYGFSAFVIGGDYTASREIGRRKYFRVDRPEDLLQLCREKNDHLNLFLKKGPDQEILS